ncbi:Pre-SET domain [Dillenia turbinata]|uniref:Pre-SET domain n=1 Tax=Dillenia turbinata TaxID=194707 RepID=A0AAN8VY06_9MAGN
MEKKRRWKTKQRLEEEEEEEEKRVGSASAVAKALFQCANLILPWLQPSDIASISSTCKTLNLISRSITSLRSSDASRSFENFPIPFVNSVDHHPYAYFLYTPSQLIASPSLRQPWGPISNPRTRPDSLRPNLSDLVLSQFGCHCECCVEAECPCWNGESVELITECGPSCGCGLQCGNRLTRRGVSIRLKIVRVWRKDWGLFADEPIPIGQFVCEYAGEVLTTPEARRRQIMYDKLVLEGHFSSALLVVREHLPSGKACLRINIDATRIGNVARFINHSCDGGNLLTKVVRIAGALLPRLCFFASKNIEKDEELSFSYGDTRLKPNGLPCFCGSSCCSGTLPSENT